MARLIPAILALALAIYAVIDCSRTPSDEMPARLPKPLWLAIIILISILGPLAWIIISRVTRAEASGKGLQPTIWSSPDSTVLRPQPGHGPADANPAAQAPDNDPDFLFKLEREIQRSKQKGNAQTKHPNGTKPHPEKTQSTLDNNVLNQKAQSTDLPQQSPVESKSVDDSLADPTDDPASEPPAKTSEDKPTD